MVNILLTAVLLLLLILFSVEDIKNRRLTLDYLLVFAAVGMILQLYYQEVTVLSLFGGIMVGGVVLILSIATEGKIGLGDGAILAVTGVYLGFQQNMELVVLALFLVGIWSLVLLAKRKSRHYEMPFVPFLLMSLLMLEGYGIIF